MNPYLDGGFLLALIAKLPGTAAATNLIRRVATPVPINLLHQLQAENLLIRFQRDPNPSFQVGGNQGQRLWRQYLDEGVFTITEADWDTGFRNAITWNRLFPESPPSPWLFLHPALALASGSSEFYSFDPRSRSLASGHGMKVLPETL